MSSSSLNISSRSRLAQGNPANWSAISVVTFALIACNVLIFVVMVLRGVPFLNPSPNDLVSWGADFGPLTTSGQWWRLVTACFLHFGIVHLAMNMYILFQVGLLTECLFGSPLFLLLYILAGVGGNIVGLFFHPLTASAGASGAIFGLFGGLLAFLLIRRDHIPKESSGPVLRSATIFLVFNLFYGLTSPNTDLVGHLGGLLTGFAVGCPLALPKQADWRRQWAQGGVLMLGTVTLAALAWGRLPKATPMQTEWYRQMMTGKRVTAGLNDTVVYSGTATRQDAETLAQMLVKIGFFRVPGLTVLFQKEAHSSSLVLPLKGNKTATPVSRPAEPAAAWNDIQYLAALRFVGPQLASAAGGVPFAIRLVDDQGDLKKEIGIHTTEVASDRDRVSYSGEATARDAASLANGLRTAGFFRNLGALVFLTKHDGLPQISFFMSDGSWNDPHPVSYLESISRKVAPSIGGPPVDVRLIDKNLQTRRELPITALSPTENRTEDVSAGNR